MYCEKVGVKYLHGVEIYVTENLEPKVRDNFHTVLLAKNYEGFLELNSLITRSCDDDHFYYTNRISVDELLCISSNIIKISACLASPLNKLSPLHKRYYEIANCYDYLEVQPHIHPEQVVYNKWLAELSLEINKPLIAGTDTHSSSKYKSECREILLIGKHKNYGDEDLFDLTYKTYDELVLAFENQNSLTKEQYMSAIQNTNTMADSIEEFELDMSIKYPILYGSREKDSEVFSELVEKRFAEKVALGVISPEEIDGFRTNINEEMRVFRKLKMDGFMLSMSELISWCKEQGMAIGTARGSVGGSRVAYVTDIIDLNPERWRTVFSRFCNEDRIEVGDIDVDVVESDRPAIFRYITERFGKERTARVASFGTLQAKGAIDDIGRALKIKWEESHKNSKSNPWELPKIDAIKKAFEQNESDARKKYPELFYYFDGMIDTKVSQSVHPAGMVISPISLDDNYGMFSKDGENCLMLDMEELHEIGAAKYDLLILRNIQIISDTCKAIGIPYPKTHEINWNDEMVWNDITKSPVGIFQFESKFAFDSLKKFQPHSIFDMSLVTAAIRPSGASYRAALLDHKPNHNPSKLIDDLLAENNGYLVYQCDVIKFLQQICGLTGSEADNIRRAIGRKDVDRLQKALPQILEGYCEKSDKPRSESELEAKEFLQIIEDASSYMFGLNHSIAYCLLGYLCAYYRYYYPIEFVTSFLNNAANDDDIHNGTTLARVYGIKITPPKYGYSKSHYFFNKEENIIAKGLYSVKFMSKQVADGIFELSKENKYKHFVDLLVDLFNKTPIDTRQLGILIKLDFFSEFGNQRELMRIYDIFEMFNRGNSKQIKKERIESPPFKEIVERNSIGTTKNGGDAKSYTLIDVRKIMVELEEAILSVHAEDLSDVIKVQNYIEIMGGSGYISGNESDRATLYVKDIFPAKRRKDSVQFGYNIITQSIGSGKESRFTVFNAVYKKSPIVKGDLIRCTGWTQENGYYTLQNYTKIM